MNCEYLTSENGKAVCNASNPGNSPKCIACDCTIRMVDKSPLTEFERFITAFISSSPKLLNSVMGNLEGKGDFDLVKNRHVRDAMQFFWDYTGISVANLLSLMVEYFGIDPVKAAISEINALKPAIPSCGIDMLTDREILEYLEKRMGDEFMPKMADRVFRDYEASEILERLDLEDIKAAIPDDTVDEWVNEAMKNMDASDLLDEVDDDKIAEYVNDGNFRINVEAA
jgi:hypothetical protein